MDEPKKHKRIGIIGCGSVGIIDGRIYQAMLKHPDILAQVEMPKKPEKSPPLIETKFIKLPETRNERRAKARKKNRK